MVIFSIIAVITYFKHRGSALNGQLCQEENTNILFF